MPTPAGAAPCPLKQDDHNAAVQASTLDASLLRKKSSKEPLFGHLPCRTWPCAQSRRRRPSHSGSPCEAENATTKNRAGDVLGETGPPGSPTAGVFSKRRSCEERVNFIQYCPDPLTCTTLPTEMQGGSTCQAPTSHAPAAASAQVRTWASSSPRARSLMLPPSRTLDINLAVAVALKGLPSKSTRSSQRCPFSKPSGKSWRSLS
mmetsp:Transcript_149212/g.387989  ORF Transcript_149212/g.387989 Transcript_149212/m.387989 type:complete len:205 (-) Transcript_149212:1205-1819(-)